MKTSLAIAVVQVSLLTVHSASMAEEPGVVGKWEVVSVVMYGKESKRDVGAVWELMANKEFAIRYPNGHVLKGRYEADTKQKPLAIDIESTEDQPAFGGGGPRTGIFEIKEGKLKLCVNGGAGVPRPTELNSKQGTLHILYEMKRAAKPDAGGDAEKKKDQPASEQQAALSEPALDLGADSQDAVASRLFRLPSGPIRIVHIEGTDLLVIIGRGPGRAPALPLPRRPVRVEHIEGTDLLILRGSRGE